MPVRASISLFPPLPFLSFRPFLCKATHTTVSFSFNSDRPPEHLQNGRWRVKKKGRHEWKETRRWWKELTLSYSVFVMFLLGCFGWEIYYQWEKSKKNQWVRGRYVMCCIIESFLIIACSQTANVSIFEMESWCSSSLAPDHYLKTVCLYLPPSDPTFLIDRLSVCLEYNHTGTHVRKCIRFRYPTLLFSNCSFSLFFFFFFAKKKSL